MSFGKGRGSKTPIIHGVKSGNIRERYSDGRTVEGRELAAVMDAITGDLGPELSGLQQVICANLRCKIIVLLQISKYIDHQVEIVSKDGDLPPILRTHFLAYADSVRRDMEALAGMASTRFKRRPPKLEDILKKGQGRKRGPKPKDETL